MNGFSSRSRRPGYVPAVAISEPRELYCPAIKRRTQANEEKKAEGQTVENKDKAGRDKDQVTRGDIRDRKEESAKGGTCEKGSGRSPQTRRKASSSPQTGHEEVGIVLLRGQPDSTPRPGFSLLPFSFYLFPWHCSVPGTGGTHGTWWDSIRPVR